ncbi:maltotransferase domain-containing protein, partial [Kitasatospora sp. NPDC058263]
MPGPRGAAADRPEQPSEPARQPGTEESRPAAPRRRTTTRRTAATGAEVTTAGTGTIAGSGTGAAAKAGPAPRRAPARTTAAGGSATGPAAKPVAKTAAKTPARKPAARKTTESDTVIGRIPVLDVSPLVDAGRRPAKAVVGETFAVTATVFREGHDAVNANVV